jgi:hypothetical protein
MGGQRRLTVISDALWQRLFNADPAVIGKSVRVNNEPWEIIGVLPPGARGLSGRADALFNLSARAPDGLNEPWSLEFSLIGRLRDGVTPDQAIAEAALIGPRIYDAFPTQGGTLTTSKACWCSSVPSPWSCSSRASTWPTCWSLEPWRGNRKSRSGLPWVRGGEDSSGCW